MWNRKRGISIFASFYSDTLDFGIDVAPGINVAHGKHLANILSVALKIGIPTPHHKIAGILKKI